MIALVGAASACSSAPGPGPAVAAEPEPAPIVYRCEPDAVAPGINQTCQSWTPPTPAPSNPNNANQARDLFRRGMEHFEKGELAGARDAFESAYALAPLAPLLFNIGRVHEGRRDLDCALDAYRLFKEQTTTQTQNDAVAERIQRIEQEREELRAATPQTGGC